MENLKTRKKNILRIFSKYFFIPILSGLFIALSFPKYFFSFSFLIGFFFLFKSLIEDNFRTHLLISFLIGFSFSFFAFGWFTYAMEVYLDTNFILANLILILFSFVFSIYQFVIFSLAVYTLKNYVGNNALLVAPLIWVLIEITREFFPFTGFPWNLMGYTLSPINEIAQISSIGGIYLLSIIALYLSVATFYLFKFRNIKSILSFFIIVGIFIGIYIYGYTRIKGYTDDGVKKKVAIIQGNIKQNEKLDKSKKDYILGKYTEFIKRADKVNLLDIVILPESSLPFSPSYIDERYINFFISLREIKTKIILTGIDDIILTINDINVYNTITLFNKNGRVLSQYRKIKLVPFGEYTPEPFTIFSKIIPYLTVGIDFSKGKEKNLIVYKDFKIIPLICFESIFPYFVADFSKNGNLIVNITNDGWFGDTSGPYQHFEMSRIRAIETGKYLVRVANTGVSAVISPVGEIKSALGLNKTGILIGDVYLTNNKTFFVSHIKEIYISYILMPFFLTVILIFYKKKIYRRD
ncbi:MAG: apolipoprotein N-acyltransferase [Persephonella sp.]|nr:MAG: apolipoprotein N-acyltransferase [Persephonella sp.]